jgi:YcxB-like protein
MRLEYKLTERDLLEAQAKHGGVWTKVLRIWGVLLIAAGVTSLVIRPRHYSNAVLPILMGVFFFFGLRLLALRSFRRDQRLQQPFEAIISDSGIDASSPTGSSKSTWGAFIRYVESKHLFLLYQAPHVFSIFPKRAFVPEDEESFRRLLNDKLGAASAAHRKRISPRTWIFLAVVTVAALLLVMVIRNIR